MMLIPILLAAAAECNSGKTSAAIANANLLETYHALVEDYGVEREEASYKLDGLTRSTRIRLLPLRLISPEKP